MTLNNFLLEPFSFENKEHLNLLNLMINSKDADLISRDIKQFIINNQNNRIKDNITDTYVVIYHDNYIGLSFVNYHPEEIGEDGNILKEEIEIGLGLLDNYKGQGLGSLLEREISEKLLELYPKFNEIVARIDNNNVASQKAVLKAGFTFNKAIDKYDSLEFVFKK